MATLSERVISITQEAYVPAVIDGVLNSNVFTARLFQRDVKTWSGRQIVVPLKVTKPTNGGSFDGVGSFDTALQSTRVRQTFTHAQNYQSVVVSGSEASLNKTDGEVLDLIKVTMEESQNALIDNIGSQIYGIGAGSDIQGLGAIVDAGTNTSTYGGLTRTTYPQVNATVTAAGGGALSFTNLATVFTGASAAGSRRQRPSLIVTTETVYNLAESLYTPTTTANYDALSPVQITAYSKPGTTFADGQSLKGHAGYEALRWRGVPIVADEKCDSGVVFELNEEYLHWYNLKGVGLKQYTFNSSSIDGVNSEVTGTFPIQWKDLMMPYNQYAEVGQFMLLGNLISEQSRRQGKLTGVTTV